MARRRRTLSPLRKVVFALIATVLAFGSLEVALRVAGAAYLHQYRPVSTSVEGGPGRELWAFGDSFTFGVGADDPALESYPAVAVAEASAHLGQPLALSNRARPGLNSTEIVDEFRDSLALAGDRRPAAVVILAGVNNERWLGQSGQFCLAGERRPAVQRWLAAHSRLYAVVRWTVLKARPARTPDRACVEIAAGFDRLEAERPDQAEDAFNRALELDPAGGWAYLGIGLARARVGDHVAAVENFRAAADVESPGRGLALAWSLRAVGAAAEARALAAEASSVEYLGDGAEVLLGWLAADADELDMARRHFLVGGHLDASDGPPAGGASTPYALDGLGWLSLREGDRERAREHFAACRTAGDLAGVTPHRLGWCHLGEAVVRLLEGRSDGVSQLASEARADPSTHAAGDALVGLGVALEGDCTTAAAAWQRILEERPSQAWAAAGVEACRRGAPVDPSSVLTLLASSPSANVTNWIDPGDTRLLRADLLRAARLAQEAKVPLYFMIYPNPDAQPELADATLAAGAEALVPVIDVRATMRRKIEGGAPWSQLFVPDGHPTTAGYQVMGEALGTALAGHTPASR